MTNTEWLKSLKPGDAVEYSGAYGYREWGPATFDGFDFDDERGDDVVLVTLADGETKWGYVDQIRRAR